MPIMASNLQTLTQFLHLMHFDMSNVCGLFFSPDMAREAHTLMQRPQPGHLSGSIV